MRRSSRGWNSPSREATPEFLLDRRDFLRAAVGGTLLAATYPASSDWAGASPRPKDVTTAPAPTDESSVWGFNNYFEYSTRKDVHHVSESAGPEARSLEITGLVERPCSIDVAELPAIAPLEERIYRHRCVEGWSAVIPWTGVPLASILEHAHPLPSARYVRFVAALPPAPSSASDDTDDYPWPYTDALTIEEAQNELPLLATGLYGHDLPLRHGAPLRLVVPWKYAYKGVKAVRTLEIVRERPSTFWTTRAPQEYSFHGNVDPDVPHPRWSQKTERPLGSDEPRPTEKYNGYADWVAHLYEA